MSRDKCLSIIIDELKKISIAEIDLDTNLFLSKNQIEANSLLYAMLRIEKRLNKNIISIFKTKDSNIMTVNNILDAIMKL